MTRVLKDKNVSQSLTIQKTVPEISRMSDWLTGSLADYGLSNSIQFRFDLCANEAVTNINSYAYPENGSHEIALLLAINPESVMLTIEDDGIAFNPFLVPEHVPPQSLSEAKIGGLGIDLIRHYVDEFNYTRLNNKNVLSIKIKLDS